MSYFELDQHCHLQTDCQIVISEAEATQNRAGKLGQQNFVVIVEQYHQVGTEVTQTGKQKWQSLQMELHVELSQVEIEQLEGQHVWLKMMR